MTKKKIYDEHGFDQDGYDIDGYDINGFNKKGINRVTGTIYDAGEST